MNLTHFEKLEAFPEHDRDLALELLNLSVCLPWEGREEDAQRNEMARQETAHQLNSFFANTQFAYAFPNTLDEMQREEIELPYDAFYIYQILQNVFGEPTAFVESEIFYLLSLDNYLISVRIPTRSSPQRIIGKSGWVFDTAVHMQITIFGPADRLPRIVSNFIKGIKRTYHKLKSQQVFRAPESVRKIMDNPFHIYMTQARTLLQTLTDDTAYASTIPFFLLWASMEAFINIVYELYLDEAYRKDKQILEQLKRRNLETKLRMAPAFCHGFMVKVIPFGDEMKQVKDIVALRNELVHANLNSSMIGFERELDSYIFVDAPKGIRTFYEKPGASTLLNKNTLHAMFETVENVVELVLQSMDVRYRRELEKVLHRERFAARLIDGQYVIEFYD